jgi:single-stranded-DNA-specific exonuclease
VIKKTIIRRPQLNSPDIDNDLHPVLNRVYQARGVSSPEQLDYSLAKLLPFNSLSNIERATELLVLALEQQKRIVIVADYDADGATACALGIRGLKMMGALDVHFIVPDRFIHGYGLSPEIVELAHELKPDLIITVDNGISSVEGVALARAKEIDVLVTDHHLPGPVLPDANVIVNPNLDNDAFQSKALAGVGVMFYVLAALRAGLREQNWFEDKNIPQPQLAQLLDLVALGTVADVVQLDLNNRIFVAQGLERIRRGHCGAGIQALFAVAGKPLEKISSSDLGFAVGPRLNAAGRLDDMRLGIECLLCDDATSALQMATRLDQLNKERREIQSEMEEEALLAIKSVDLQAEASLPYGICLYQDNWHQGVVGIVASKIKEKTHRPVIAFAKESEELLKGSARSIRDIHIRDAIEAIASAHPGVISKFGGHAMAAGLSLRRDKFEEFCEYFDQEIERQIKIKGFDSELLSDGELAENQFSLELAEKFKQAGPWGQGFPEPQFDGKFNIHESRIVGGKHLKLKLYMNDKKDALDAIAFNHTDEHWPRGVTQVSALYRLDINDYRGRRTPQLIVEHIEPISSEL